MDVHVTGSAGDEISGAIEARLSGDGGSTSASAGWSVSIIAAPAYPLLVSLDVLQPTQHVQVAITNPGTEDVVVATISASGPGVGNSEITCKGEGSGVGSGGAASKGKLSLPAGTTAECTINLKLNPALPGPWSVTVTVSGTLASGGAASGSGLLMLGG